MDARFSRQVIVPGIGPEGQARIQSSSFCAAASKDDALRCQSLRLYATRAGLKESSVPLRSDSEQEAHPLVLKLNEFLTDPACRSISLGAADALLALNDALNTQLASSAADASEPQK